MTYTVLMLYSVTEAWLRLFYEAHEAFNTKALEPIFRRYADRVKVRLFDSEPFSASV